MDVDEPKDNSSKDSNDTEVLTHPLSKIRWKDSIIIFLLFLVIYLSMLLSCDSSEDRLIKDVLISHTRAIEEEDLNGSLEFIHADSLLRSREHTLLTLQVFMFANVSYEIESLTILNRNESEATVRMVCVTEGEMENGDTFRNNRTTQELTLKKNGRDWFIWDSKIIEIEYLD